MSVRKILGAVNLSCQIERKAQRLPRFLVVPADLLEGWKLGGTTVVEAMINGIDVGRRSLKKWDDDRWFVELAQSMCERVGVDTGDRVTSLFAWLPMTCLMNSHHCSRAVDAPRLRGRS
jgi:hypothetical protein